MAVDSIDKSASFKGLRGSYFFGETVEKVVVVVLLELFGVKLVLDGAHNLNTNSL